MSNWRGTRCNFVGATQQGQESEAQELEEEEEEEEESVGGV